MIQKSCCFHSWTIKFILFFYFIFRPRNSTHVCYKVLVLVLLALTPVGAVPSVIQTAANVTRLEATRAHVFSGLHYTEIIILLFLFHAIKLSLRQLKRILRANDLYRNKNYTREVKDLISTEIEDSAKCIGYRAIWRRLVNDHHVRVPRDRVLHIMRELDQEGVRRRKAHMLVRRRYYARGPDYGMLTGTIS